MLARLTSRSAAGLIDVLLSPATLRRVGEPLFRVLGRRRHDHGIDRRSVRRILVMRLDEIGDVVLTSPFLRELRRMCPNAWITLVVKPATFNLVELCPYVNEILTYDWQTTGRAGRLRRQARLFSLAARRLWRRRFDLAIVPRWDTDAYCGVPLAYASGARWRVGYSESVCEHKQQLNRGYDQLLTHVLHDYTLRHEVEHNLGVLRCLGLDVESARLELWFDSEDNAFAELVLQSQVIRPTDFLIGFGPGAGWPKRMWPMSRFAELGASLLRECACQLIVVGGERERHLGEHLRRELGQGVINVVGRATLRQTAAVLQRCHLFVGNDSGPMHVAAAAGVPVVEISCHPLSGSPAESHSPTRFGPWGVPHRIVQPERSVGVCSETCEGDDAHCILGVSVAKVKEAVLALVASRHRIAVTVTQEPTRGS